MEVKYCSSMTMTLRVHYTLWSFSLPLFAYFTNFSRSNRIVLGSATVCNLVQRVVSNFILTTLYIIDYSLYVKYNEVDAV